MEIKMILSQQKIGKVLKYRSNSGLLTNFIKYIHSLY